MGYNIGDVFFCVRSSGSIDEEQGIIREYFSVLTDRFPGFPWISLHSIESNELFNLNFLNFLNFCKKKKLKLSRRVS